MAILLSSGLSFGFAIFSDVLGALTKDLGYTREQVGKIDVNEFSTYVAVDRAIARQAGFTQESFEACLKDKKIYDGLSPLAADTNGLFAFVVPVLDDDGEKHAFEVERKCLDLVGVTAPDRM